MGFISTSISTEIHSKYPNSVLFLSLNFLNFLKIFFQRTSSDCCFHSCYCWILLLYIFFFFLHFSDLVLAFNVIIYLKGPLPGLRQFLTTENALKMWRKNSLYFTLKALFEHFCPDFLAMWRDALIKKLWLISKFMMSQTGQQIITIHNKEMQSGKQEENAIRHRNLSVNKITIQLREKYFSSTIMQKLK